MGDLLLYEIKELQANYKAVLIEAERSIFQKDTHAILDEINVFWNRNKRLVQCALEYLSKPYRTFVFTAATILDIEDNEHYPFLCFGDYHIWDDPIYGYIRMAAVSHNEEFRLELQEQIHATIKDNIEILDNVNETIFIFPVRMLSGIENEVIHHAAHQAFLSLFTMHPQTMEEYFENFDTIDDIVLGLRKDIENMITLSEHEDLASGLQQRFYKYKADTQLPLPEDASDALIFAFTLHGYLTQAFDIMLTCSCYQFIPYIRFVVAFKYILILSGNFPDIPELELWLFSSAIAHVLHNSFDKEKYSVIEFGEFVRKIKEAEFERKVFETLKKRQISLEHPAIQETIEIIDEQLTMCFQETI
jgi:hypothetical protein